MDATSAALAVVGKSITVDVGDRLEVPVLSDEVAAGLGDETGVVPVVAGFSGQESSRSINDLRARVPTVLHIFRSVLLNQEAECGLMKQLGSRSRGLHESLA